VVVPSRLAELRARRALAEARLDPELVLSPIESVTNEVWSAGDVVVRVNRRIHSRLRRESELAALLPPTVRYPALVAAGRGQGADWAVLSRVPGIPLVRCWPGLTTVERKGAISELASAVRALHEVEAPRRLSEADDPPQLLGTGAFPAEPLFAGLERARHLANVDKGVLTEAEAFVRALQPALEPFRATTLIHGDLHFQNVLWDGDHLSALLDLEFARAAPADLDLDVFLRFCCYPFLFVPESREAEAQASAYEQVPYWFRDAYPSLFGHPRLFDRLRLYAVAFDVKDLLAWPPREPLARVFPHHPYRRLVDTLRGTSHLDRLAGR
jgi:aminoglycoside phosphotransferase (APT) family kinase protein